MTERCPLQHPRPQSIPAFNAIAELKDLAAASRADFSGVVARGKVVERCAALLDSFPHHVDHAGPTGAALLYEAAAVGSVELVTLLLRTFNADPNCHSHTTQMLMNDTPLHAACRCDWWWCY